MRLTDGGGYDAIGAVDQAGLKQFPIIAISLSSCGHAGLYDHWPFFSGVAFPIRAREFGSIRESDLDTIHDRLDSRSRPSHMFRFFAL